MRLFFVCLSLIFCFSSYGQTARPGSISGSFLNQSFGYPSKHVFSGQLHPGFAVEASFNRKKDTKVLQQWTAEFSNFHHESFQTGLMMMGGLQFHYFEDKRFHLSWGPKAGYLHTFYPTGVYEFTSNGYQTKSGGRANFIIGLNGRMHYQPIKTLPVEVYTGIIVTLDGPFAIAYGVPVIPRTFSQIGITYKQKK